MRTRLVTDGSHQRALFLYPASAAEYAGALLRGQVHGFRPRSDAALPKLFVVTTERDRASWRVPRPDPEGSVTVTAPGDVFQRLESLRPGRVAVTATAPLLEAPRRLAPSLVDASPALPSSGSPLPACSASSDPLARGSLLPGAVERNLSDAGALLARLSSPGLDSPSALHRKREALFREFGAELPKLLQWSLLVDRVAARRRQPETFSAAVLERLLDRHLTGLDSVKHRVVEAVEALVAARETIFFEDVSDPASVRAVLLEQRPVPRQPVVLCFAGPRGTGKGRLCSLVADSLGQPVAVDTVPVDPPPSWLAGTSAKPGLLLSLMEDEDCTNPVVLLHHLDRLADPCASTLAAALDPACSSSFPDQYLDFMGRKPAVTLDVSGVFWLATATDPDAIPISLHPYVFVFPFAPYSEREKVSIAANHFLSWSYPRLQSAASALSPGSRPSPARVYADHRVVAEAAVSPGQPLEAWLADTAGRPAGSGPSLRIDPDLIRWVVRAHTSEPGVTVLQEHFARLRDYVAGGQSSTVAGPVDITYEDALACFGPGSPFGLPELVAEAVRQERERVRMAGDGSMESQPSERWIEWMEHLPWTGSPPPLVSRGELARALDASHAAMAVSKATIVEHVCGAVREQRSTLCLAGPPGVGKTSLAQAVAAATGRPLARLSCGGWHDGTELRGHNRTWRASQPGAILRELRRAGCRWPVFVLDEIDKLGSEAADVLLEILDPVQRREFRDAYVELPFDLSDVLFVTTANRVEAIPNALRDRLDIARVPGYSVPEKVAIVRERFLPVAAAAAGARVLLDDAVCAYLVRAYTHEEGVRALQRAVVRLCERVADTPGPVPLEVQAADLPQWLGPPPVPDPDDSVALAQRVAAATLPAAVVPYARRTLRVIDSYHSSVATKTEGADYLSVLLGVRWSQLGWPVVPSPDPFVSSADLEKRIRSAVVGHDRCAKALARFLVPAVPPRWPGRALCIAGCAGTGKMRLAVQAAAAAGFRAVVLDCRLLRDVPSLVGVRDVALGALLKTLGVLTSEPLLLVLDRVDAIPVPGPAHVLAGLLRDRTGGRSAFRDEYLRAPVDLAGVPVLVTARDPEAIVSSLRRLLEFLPVYGYDAGAKLRIARERLWPALVGRFGVPARFDEALVSRLVAETSWETGVAALEAALYDSLLGTTAPGPPPGVADTAEGGIGRATGLLVDDTGATLLPVQAGAAAGPGRVVVTGRSGRVLRESVRTARQWVVGHGSAFSLASGWERDTDLHIHLAAPAKPKTGPSAGLAVVAAVVSALSGRPLLPGVVITGEIALDDRVRPVGGIEEKVLAAVRAGATDLYLPATNCAAVLKTLPRRLRSGLALRPAASVRETLAAVLGPLP